jgi:hypothetical protein
MGTSCFQPTQEKKITVAKKDLLRPIKSLRTMKEIETNHSDNHDSPLNLGDYWKNLR